MTARSPLFAALRRAVRDADRAAAIPLDEVMDRRAFLRGLGAAGAGAVLSACGVAPARAQGEGAGLGTLIARAAGQGARVAIVGAGMAGLAAGRALAKAGVAYTVYEGNTRVGGRVRSAGGLMGPGLTTEVGAEFIDSSHVRMLGLAREFGFRLIDVGQDHSPVASVYRFGGVRYTEQDVATAIRPYLARFKADQAKLGDAPSYHAPGAWAALDRLSMADYLDRLGVGGWLRAFLEAAYLSECGLDPAEQSAVNFVGLVGTALQGGAFPIIGDSDERYKVAGGNERIPRRLAELQGERLRLGHRLVALEAAGAGYRLSFAQSEGPTREVQADFVVLALPFSTLREVDLRVALPAAKRRAIAELGYGTNAKLFLGFRSRVWREQGCFGAFLADGLLPNGWDNTYAQPGIAGSLTIYAGGRGGVELARGTAADQAAARLPGLDAIFPGAAAAYTGQAERFDWPGHVWARGSYGCYRPGQAAAFKGAEGEPVGRLLFAGEHCAGDNQGFMEGALETGEAAARAIVKALRARSA